MTEHQPKTDVQEPLALPERADQAAFPNGIDLPDEIKHRQDRLLVMDTAKAKTKAPPACALSRSAGSHPSRKRQATGRTHTSELKALPTSLGQTQGDGRRLRNNSESNIAACEAAEIAPYLTVAHEDHHPSWRTRFEEPTPLDSDATAQQ